MVLRRNANQFLLLSGLLLVLGSNILLYRSPIGLQLLPENSNGVVIGSLIDLTIIAPLLFLTWKRNMNWKSFIILMAAGLVLARFLIPMEYLAPFKTLTLFGFVIEGAIVLLEVLLVVTLFKYLPEIIRTVKKSSLPVVFSFAHTVENKIPQHILIQILCAEFLMFYYAIGSWKKNPIREWNTFTYHKNSSLIAFLAVIIHAMVLETAIIHWALHGKSIILSTILLVLNIYSFIFLLGHIQAIRLNPFQIEHDRLYLSMGLMKRMEVKWSDIEEIIEDGPVLEQKLSKDTIDFIARDFETVYPDFIIRFKEPVEATLAMGFKKKYKQVAIRVDEPEKFGTMIKKTMLQ